MLAGSGVFCNVFKASNELEASTSTHYPLLTYSLTHLLTYSLTHSSVLIKLLYPI